MKKPPNRFELPIQRLSWWADFKIKRRLKAAAAAESAGFSLNRFASPSYAFATLGAAIVTLGLFSQTWAPQYLGAEQTLDKKIESIMSEDLEMAPKVDLAMENLSAPTPTNLAAGSPMMAEPMMARSKMTADSSLPEIGEVPLALDSYMIVEERAEGEALVRDLEKIRVVELGYGGGFNYGVTFILTGNEEVLVTFDGNHQNYDLIWEQIVSYGQKDLGLNYERDEIESLIEWDPVLGWEE